MNAMHTDYPLESNNDQYLNFVWIYNKSSTFEGWVVQLVWVKT